MEASIEMGVKGNEEKKMIEVEWRIFTRENWGWNTHNMYRFFTAEISKAVIVQVYLPCSICSCMMILWMY